MLSITEQQKNEFERLGFAAVEDVLNAELLQLARDECTRFIDLQNAQMDELGVDTLYNISHRNNRYFIPHAASQSEALRQVVFSEEMAEVCTSFLGPDVYLFFDQFVVKCAKQGMSFSWHQDSGYIGYPHRPYLSCWCPLDDVSEENGTVYLLPYEDAGTREIVPHVPDEASGDLVGYRGDKPGVPISMKAGGIAAFSSTTLHRSGPNATGQMRRVYLMQYSAEPLMKADGSGPWAHAVPFVKNGEIVFDPAEEWT